MVQWSDGGVRCFRQGGGRRASSKRWGLSWYGVAGWFEKRGEIPLARPPGLREYGPVADDPDRPEEEFIAGAVTGVAFGLEYCGILHGWASTRTIRCLAIDLTNPCSLKAYCNVRRTTRTFRVDRIISIADLRTGRILSSAEHMALLAGNLPGQMGDQDDHSFRAFCELRQATRDGVFALLQIAMSDGRLGDPAKWSSITFGPRPKRFTAPCPLPI